MKDLNKLPKGCYECCYSNSEWCVLTGNDMLISTVNFKKICPLYNKEKFKK